MENKHFEFEFEFNGKSIPATCDVYTLENIKEQTEMPFKYPIYRVAININSMKPIFFLYYEINQPNKRFFYYPLEEGKKAEMFKSIEQALQYVNVSS